MSDKRLYTNALSVQILTLIKHTKILQKEVLKNDFTTITRGSITVGTQVTPPLQERPRG